MKSVTWEGQTPFQPNDKKPKKKIGFRAKEKIGAYGEVKVVLSIKF
jgi:hypothetical protein